MACRHAAEPREPTTVVSLEVIERRAAARRSVMTNQADARFSPRMKEDDGMRKYSTVLLDMDLEQYASITSQVSAGRTV